MMITKRYFYCSQQILSSLTIADKPVPIPLVEFLSIDIHYKIIAINLRSRVIISSPNDHALQLASMKSMPVYTISIRTIMKKRMVI